MKIRVDDIPEDGLNLNFSGDRDILSLPTDWEETGQGMHIDPKLVGNVRIIPVGADVLISGEVEAAMSFQCDRCLEWFPVENRLSLNILVRTGPEQQEAEEDIEADDQDTVLIDGKEFDLAAILLQEFLLEIPMKTLCREDCPGLCPFCGEIRGSDKCRCSEDKPADPRWKALEKLKSGAGS